MEVFAEGGESDVSFFQNVPERCSPGLGRELSRIAEQWAQHALTSPEFCTGAVM
jgi:hypothetical protein